MRAQAQALAPALALALALTLALALALATGVCVVGVVRGVVGTFYFSALLPSPPTLSFLTPPSTTHLNSSHPHPSTPPLVSTGAQALNRGGWVCHRCWLISHLIFAHCLMLDTL